MTAQFSVLPITTNSFEAYWAARGIYLAEENGIDCTGATDASVALQAAIDAMPNSATLEFPIGATVKLGATITITNRVGISLMSRVRQVNAPGTPGFLWTASSGVMFDFEHCDHPSVIGLRFSNDGVSGNCDTFIKFDGNPAGHIGTLGFVDMCTFNLNGAVNTVLAGMVSISPTATNNHENYTIQNCSFFGAGSISVRARDGVTSAASPNVASATAAFVSGDVGKRIRLSYGGSGVNGGGFLDTIVKTFTDAQHIVLNANMPATGTQTNVTIHIGQCYGIGIRNGASQNALQQQFRNIQYTNCAYGIYLAGGNAQMEHISGGSSDYGIFVAGFVAEQCSVNWYESESDCRGIECNGPALMVTNSRMSNSKQFGDGFFKFDTGGPVTLLGTFAEFTPATNQVLVGTAGLGNPLVTSLGNSWNSCTLAQVGFPQFGGQPLICFDVFDQNRFMMLNPKTVDPHVVGQVWSNAGVMTISAG